MRKLLLFCAIILAVNCFGQNIKPVKQKTDSTKNKEYQQKRLQDSIKKLCKKIESTTATDLKKNKFATIKKSNNNLTEKK
jgi:GH24 family phage-related lysozyme (muramidase)